MCEEILVTVVWFGVLYYRESSERGVSIEASVVSMYNGVRV